MIDTHQFYPTPESLADRAFSLFEEKIVVRLLEPSAGNGDLLAPLLSRRDWHQCRNTALDVAELNLSHHATLRDKNLNVVGVDFLDMKDLSPYSHILMNPPFAQGVDHVLHAWDYLYAGEIVAILNAETIRNPFSKERQRLVRLLALQSEEAEFVPDAFLDAQRQTGVEIALIHLRKIPGEAAFRGDFWETLKSEPAAPDGFETPNHLALRGKTIANLVAAYNAAWAARKAAIQGDLQARYYSRILGQRLMNIAPEETRTHFESDSTDPASLGKEANALFGKALDDLKDRGWTSVIHSTEAEKYVSTRVREKIRSDFEQIKKLDFTVSNIYGFLMGLAENQSSIQLDMVCEIFDKIVSHHSDNTIFYMGWKSNDRHRLGMAIRPKRFILPGFSSEGWRSTLGYSQEQRLQDIDKVFAMLDGKQQPTYGLVDLFRNEYQDLKHGSRCASDYFEVRWYPGVGTIHFYPTNPKLIDRMNAMVGRSRHWLPENDSQAGEEFWKHRRGAEKVTTAIFKNQGREIVRLLREGNISDCWGRSGQDRADQANESLWQTFHAAFVSAGLDPNLALTQEPQKQEMLLLECW